MSRIDKQRLIQSQHDAGRLQNFAKMVADMPKVVEFYRMSGELNYLLKLMAQDRVNYSRLNHKLIANVQLTNVSSSFAMEQIKYTAALLLPEVEDA